MKKINLLFFQTHAAYGSVEFYLETLANNLISKGDYNIQVLVPDDPASKRLIANLDRDILIKKYPRLISAPMEINFFIRYFRKQKPDIIHFNDPAPCGMLAARLAGIKNRVLTYHTPTLDEGFNARGRIAWKLAFDRGLRLIATNEELKDIAIWKIRLPAKNFIAIHYGLNTGRFISEKDNGLRRKLGINESDFVIGTISRIEHQKRHDILLKAISLIDPDIKEKLKILIVGDGSRLEDMKRLSRNLNLERQVIFTGYETEIEKHLSLMDVFVLTSDYEGACMALIEAMAMSCAIISTDVPGARDTLGFGKCGRLVPKGNPRALAKEIERLINDRNELLLLCQASRRRFLEHFTIEKTVDKTDSFYKALTNRHIKK